MVKEHIRIPEHPTGAHWWLNLKKTNWNTKDVALLLAEIGNARIREVGYAGLKDRKAITSQWFSVRIEHIDPLSLPARLPEGIQLLEHYRARHSIRRGGLLANEFRIRLRNVEGDRDAINRTLVSLGRGTPNYFGEQRFGINGNNLVKVRQLFRNELSRPPRFERGLYLSAARSSLFNQVLAHRVRQQTWNQLLPGEAAVLNGSRSRFGITSPDAELIERLHAGDIHPSGPLVGIGDEPVSGQCLEMESEILAQDPELVEGLKTWRLKAERRPLRLVPENIQKQWTADDLVLSFKLPPGSFATTVLAELVSTRVPAN